MCKLVATTEIFIKKYIKKYPDSNFLFNKIEYKSWKEKIEIGCEHGYWFIIANSFMNGHCSCKECVKINSKKYNNITITNSILVREWHSTKNNNKKPEYFTHGSEQKIWWQCQKDNSHEWIATIGSRAGKNNTIKSKCPYCDGKANAKNNLTITNFSLVKEWHPLKNNKKKPENFTFGSGAKIWWQCQNNHSHEWQTTISCRAGKNNTIKSGCPYCDGKANDKNNLTITNFYLIQEWHQTKNNGKIPEHFTYGSHEKVWWQCIKDNNHEWEAVIKSRAGKDNTIKNGCPHCISGNGEKFTRYAFEKLFEKLFLKNRPDFLKNPQTGYNLELDGFCEEMMIAFEYQGNQHEKIVSKFKMTQEILDYQKQKDQFKRDKCKDFGVKLIEVPQFNYKFRKEHLKDFIIQKCIELDIALPENVNDIEISYHDFMIKDLPKDSVNQ